MAGPTILTPRNKIIHHRGGRISLKYASDFRPKWQRRYTMAQIYVDTECLEQSEPYIPYRSGYLINSGYLSTDVGSGKVTWGAPYARDQYYKAKPVGASQFGRLRGPHWFARMFSAWGDKIIAGAKRLAGSA